VADCTVTPMELAAVYAAQRVPSAAATPVLLAPDGRPLLVGTVLPFQVNGR